MATNAPPRAEVKVHANGEVFLDDEPATLDILDRRFAELVSAKGEVWYYREAGQEEPPPIVMDVLELVFKHGLPISMSSKPDFSDTIDDQGISRPRPPAGDS